MKFSLLQKEGSIQGTFDDDAASDVMVFAKLWGT